MLPGLKKGWELAPQNFCTPLPYWKKHAKAFFGRNTQKKVNFFMSRRNACYQTEEIAPPLPPWTMLTLKLRVKELELTLL